MNSMKKTNVHFGVICALYALLFYTGAVLDNKVDHIFIFTMPGAAWFFIFIYTLSDAVTEVYGPRVTWANLIAGYLICCLFIIITVFTIHMPYAHVHGFQHSRILYLSLSDALIKCFGFGYLVFFIGMFINVKLLGRWKLKYQGKHYFWRSYCSSAISEGFVVITANLLIWSTRLPLKEVMHIIIGTYIAKLLLTFVWAFIGVGIKNVLYCIEGGPTPYVYNADLYDKTNKK